MQILVIDTSIEIKIPQMQFHADSSKQIVWTQIYFLLYLAQAFAADCIFESPCISIRWVRSLLSMNQAIEKKSRQSRDSNPGLLGEKGKHYLCAMQPPPTFKCRYMDSCYPIFQVLVCSRTSTLKIMVMSYIPIQNYPNLTYEVQSTRHSISQQNWKS